MKKLKAETTTDNSEAFSRLMDGYAWGSSLTTDDQKHVLRAYVHRYTGDHTPQWVRKAREEGTFYPIHFWGDLDWLRNTQFKVRKDGRLDMRAKMCYSTPTFPYGREIGKSGGEE